MKQQRLAALLVCLAALVLTACGQPIAGALAPSPTPDLAQLRAITWRPACDSYRLASEQFQSAAGLLGTTARTPYAGGVVLALEDEMMQAYQRLPDGRIADDLPQHLYIAYGEYVLAAEYARRRDPGLVRGQVVAFQQAVFFALQDPGRASLCTR